MSDLELEEWRTAWREDGKAPPVPDDLRRRVERGSRRLVLATVGEVALGVASAIAIAVALRRRPDAPTIVWAIAVVVLFAAAWTFTLQNRRGVWRPSGDSVHDHLALAVARCRRRVRTTTFAALLLAVECAFLLPWGLWERATTPPRDAAEAAARVVRWVAVAAVALTAVAWMWWARRRAQRELRVLEDFARELNES